MYGLNAMAQEGVLMEKGLSFSELTYSGNVYGVSTVSQGLRQALITQG